MPFRHDRRDVRRDDRRDARFEGQDGRELHGPDVPASATWTSSDHPAAPEG